MKEGQQVALGFHNAPQPVGGGQQQRRFHVFERVPSQYAVEVFVRIFQAAAQEVIDSPRIGLVGDIFSESLLKNAQEIFRVELVSQAGNEVDILLAGSPQIQDGQAGLIAERTEELIEAPALARLHGFSPARP